MKWVGSQVFSIGQIQYLQVLLQVLLFVCEGLKVFFPEVLLIKRIIIIILVYWIRHSEIMGPILIDLISALCLNNCTTGYECGK